MTSTAYQIVKRTVVCLIFNVLLFQQAASEPITIDTVTGNLEVQQPDSSWSPILPSKVKLPISLRTGAGGKAVESQGKTSIELNSNTEITLAGSDTRASELISIVRQRLGNAAYKVERHPGDFKVETSYLVSVVKGTRFTVFADEKNAFVSVTEGLVEVNDLRTGEVRDLRPGEIARSSVYQSAASRQSMVIKSRALGSQSVINSSESNTGAQGEAQTAREALAKAKTKADDKVNRSTEALDGKDSGNGKIVDSAMLDERTENSGYAFEETNQQNYSANALVDAHQQKFQRAEQSSILLENPEAWLEYVDAAQRQGLDGEILDNSTKANCESYAAGNVPAAQAAAFANICGP